MSGYIKYFENGGKNMSFVIKDYDVLDKYNKNWDKIKETLSIKFNSMLVYDEQVKNVVVKKIIVTLLTLSNSKTYQLF